MEVAQTAAEAAIQHWDFADVRQVIVCGSVRRLVETVSDVDLVVVTDAALMTDLPLPAGWHVTPKTANRWLGNVWVEAWWCPPYAVGPMTLFNTGPGSLNVYMRRRAQKRGWKLSQYGLLDGIGDRIDDNTEEGCFEALEMTYLHPQERSYWEEMIRGQKD